MNSRHRNRKQHCGLATLALVTAWLGTLEAAPAAGLPAVPAWVRFDFAQPTGFDEVRIWIERSVTVPTKRQWTVFGYPHSHQDIGYTEPQDVLAKVHINNMNVGLELGRATPAYPDAALDLVAKHVGVFTQPPRNVPTRGMPDGPLLGNGDVGVALAGPPEAQVFYIGKNDFWTRHPANAKVINVGRLELSIPALQGASYRQEQDLARAEVRGTFTKGGPTIRTRSWVDANTNLLLTELQCDGPEPVTVAVRPASGGGGEVPAQVADNGRPVNVGRELHGGGRWYFDGEIADVVVTNVVFRYSETGTPWWNDNTLGIQHIYPAGAVGLDSHPKLLEICHTMIEAMHRWHDDNGFSSWYTACARVGYDPKTILAKMRAECDRCSMPNLVLTYGGGGIENVSGFLAINEMLMQSHEGVIRFFPVWPKEQNARFGDLRAVGAFLVSAELKDGVVSGVKIRSEKGRACTVQNPWPAKKVQLARNGTVEEVEMQSGDRFTFKTGLNETIELHRR